MIAVVKIVDNEVQWAEPTCDGCIQNREERIRDGLWRARKFIHGIELGAKEAGANPWGDLQYNTWLKIGDTYFRIRETLPSGERIWRDHTPFECPCTAAP